MGVYEKMYRVTVAEAAAKLGVKEQAIRKRIQRSTLAHDKDDDGRVYVYLDPGDGATGRGNGIDSGVSTLVQSLQEQIACLRQEAEDWKEEARRKDTIIMSLTQHPSELQASKESRVASDTAREHTGKGYRLYSPGARTAALLAVQVLLRAMKGTGVRRVVCLVTLWVLAVLMVVSAASAQGE